jgi:hypothetical protein
MSMNEMVAEQLYSFSLTVFFGLGTDRPIGLWKFAVSKTIGRAEMEHRMKCKVVGVGSYRGLKMPSF